MVRSQRAAYVAAASIVAAAATIGALVGPATADDRADLEQQRKGMAGQIEDAKKAFDESSKKFVKATDALKSAQQQLGSARANLGQTRQKLSGAKALDETLQVKLDRAEGQLSTARTSLKQGKEARQDSAAAVREFTLQNLTDGNARLEAFGELLHGADPMRFAEEMSLATAVSEAQVARMQQFEAHEVMLEINKRRVEKARDQVAAARAETQRNVVRQQSLAAEAEVQTERVDELVDARESAKETAARVRAEDERRL